MLIVVVKVSGLGDPFLRMGIWRVNDLPCLPQLAEYIYQRLEEGKLYPTPGMDQPGDMECGCNTVIYRWDL